MSNLQTIATNEITPNAEEIAPRPLATGGLRKRMKRIHGSVTSSPRIGRSTANSIAFVYTGDSSLSNPFELAAVCGISRELHDHGYDLLALDVRRAKLPDESYTQMFARKGVRGAILRTARTTREVCDALLDEGFPAVVVGERMSNPKVSCVYSDFETALRDAVEHLVRLGHRHIALGVSSDAWFDWETSYRAALAAFGVTFNPELLLNSPSVRGNGTHLLQRLTAMSPKPTAVLLTQPQMAVGLLEEARAGGLKIPESLSVVGVDDAEHSYRIAPDLTAICQDTIAAGREAMIALQQIITKKTHPPIRRILRPWLEVHRSTGLAPVI
jgi:DNA-binding LacI/PurR family transcriptional regulator